MLDRLGKRRFVAPIVAVIFVFCVLALMMYPTMNAAPKDVPFAIVNLDEGATTPLGSINLGDEVVSKISEDIEPEEGVESPIAWTELNSEAALDEAMESNEFYGAIVIPKDFTTKQAAMLAVAEGASATAPTETPNASAALAAVAEGVEAPTIEIVINQGKNVMLATTMQTAMTTMLDQTGVNTEVTVINGSDSESGGMGPMMSGGMMIMPIVLMTLISSVLSFLVFRPKKEASRNERLKAYGKQLAYAVVMSFLVACASVLMVTWIAGMDAPVGTLLLFLWFASFCIMALFIGALNIAVPLGALVILSSLALGMSSGMLAPEMLPAFWHNWVYPWAPQHFIADGISAVIYMGKGVWNSASLPLTIIGFVGLALMVAAFFLPPKVEAQKHRQ